MSSHKALHGNRTIRQLYEEDQLGLARIRFEKLSKESQADNVAKNEQQLYKEVFELGEAGDYPIHQIIQYCGNSDAEALTLSILEFSKEFPLERRKMLSATNPRYGRTPLHWAAYAPMKDLDVLVRAYPEALLTRDAKNVGERTPLEIFKRYHSKDDSRAVFLEQMTASWMCHRLRMSVHLCANRYFGSSEATPLVPFSNSDRVRVAKIRPKPWFALSVIGYFLQREMKPLALHILAFAGGNAKVAASRKRRRAASS